MPDNFVVMRLLVCSLLLPLLLLVPASQSPATFSIPADMHETWPGAKLNDVDSQLLRKAVESDLRRLNSDLQDDQRLKFESIDSADLDLGSLGKGVLVTLSESVLCGTGGCPIYAYIREEKAYRKVLGAEKGWALGWAFAVVKSKATIPDLVIASNLSGGIITLTLYRYSGKTFTSEGCENLTAKQGAPSGRSRFDSAAVVISPCGTQAP